jgi:rod shape-determining protein MreD
MGRSPLTWLNTAAIVLIAYVAVFLEARVSLVRNWIGVQPDLLPALMVYCGLSTSLVTITLTAFLGGLWFDSLSSNPLGATVLPLLIVGVIVYRLRDLVLRDQPYARLMLGGAAGAAVPLMTVLLLLANGYKPLIGWGSLWQWTVLALAAGLLTPVCFWTLERISAALAYTRTTESTFRPDREIKRGRA